MEISLIVEIAGGIVATLGGLFALIRYMITQNSKREDRILTHHESQQTAMMEQQAMMMDHFEKKNGHMERMSKDFTVSLDKNTDVLAKAVTELKLLKQSHNNNRS